MTSAGFDPDKWLRYKASPEGPTRQRLLGELVQENEGLTRTIVAQLCGRGENRPGIRQIFRKEPGAEHLESEDAQAAGRIGMLKALRDFKNPERGGISHYAAWKIRYEIQCAIGTGSTDFSAQVVRQPKGAAEADRVRGILFEGDSDENGHIQGRDFWSRFDAVNAPESEPEGTDPAPEPRPTSALADFVERRCEFRPPARTPREQLLTRYEQHARLLGFPPATHMLERLLESRGVRVVRSRIARCDAWIDAYAGVRCTTIRALSYVP